MAAPFIEMINNVCAHLAISQKHISSAQKYIESNQPTEEIISMISTGIDGVKYAAAVITQLKETVLLMDHAVFNASVNVEYAIGLLDMVKQTMPERQHMAMEALSSFNLTAFKMLEDAWDLEKAAAQAMEDEA